MEMTANFAQGLMLRCPVKAWAGIDCPGCGFQRSLWALLQGDLGESWHHYPPMIPFLVTLLMAVVAVKSRLPYRMAMMGVSLAITCSFIAVNYAFKMW